MKKRILAVLLSAAMMLSVLSVLPETGIAAQAAEDDTEYVSLPVTIRDYASDGMLFQWNELGDTGDAVIGGTVVTPTVKYTDQAGGNTTKTPGDGYIRYTATGTGNYITYTVSGSHTRTSMRYCVVKYRTNANYGSALLPTIGHRWNNGSSNDYKNLPTAGYNSNDFKSVVVDLGSGSDTASYVTLYPRLDAGKYMDIAEIAFFSAKSDADSYASGTAVGGVTYHHGSTKGYGLLQSSEADKFNDLTESSSIAGTTLTQNGKWNGAPETITPSTSKLNSGAIQTLYGCYVRTDLVEANLDDNKKPVYTEAAVTYLANYMQKTLPEVWKNGDGSYNMWYVMGTKLYNDNNEYVGPGSSATRDLAAVLRSTITGGLGSYADTRSKTLSKVTDCTTYFDAAYFLLHNTFADNEGYGQSVSEYNTINLVKKTVEGKTYYVYNSAYDGTEYDTANGVIYNSQTDTITTRTGTTYVRGNLQAENRFDPIGAIGDGNAYYGKNGDLYAKAIGRTSDDKYYNNTNYNLTLEGHAQFIYYEDDDLYFNFTGDDDVYLYINGTRVLDLGGAHAISKCGISLNDVQKLCGLKDGEVYDFDFYYMERHGTAANFGIETNIKIVDPSMLTEKHAYQDNQDVGYNGFVNPNKPVTYEFKLTNNGEAQIQEVTFKDDDIGVELTKDNITLNSETAITDLSVQILNPDGTTKVSYAAGSLTEDGLKELLAGGLLVGESIRLYGFGYTIPDNKWSDDKFPNTVYTTAISTGENASHKKLNGVASCQVQKQEYQFAPMHYYEWKGKGVTAMKKELIQPVLDAVKNSGVTEKNADIKLCSASGQISEAGINGKAQVTDEGIKYTGTATGADTYYYKVGNYGPIAVTVYSYDVADNTYVLDYSLPVELNGEDYGLRVNDTVKLVENPYTTVDSTTGISEPTSEYGEFNWDGGKASLKYTLNKFMNDKDEVSVTVRVLEEGADKVTSKTGVIMTEKVTVVPANVVYYEDDFPGITYVNTDENGWAYYKSQNSEGNEQSADQDMSYGKDPNYQEDKDTTYTKFVADTSDLNAYQQEAIGYLNAYLRGGDASNGTIHELVVKETADVMSFEFKGTGFEIVSRTTDNTYAVVKVKVEKKNSDGTYTKVKELPVITESKGGDLYQVPIISVTDLERAEYKVTLTAAGSTSGKTRVLYIDGIRIYEPLDDVDEVLYYNPEEAEARFLEVKEQIQNGKAIYADISDTGDETKLVTGTTYIEEVEGNGLVLTAAADVEQYMSCGPNNELYLQSASANGILAFFLYPVAEVPEEKRVLEIGAHRKADSALSDNEAVSLVYGSTADSILEGTNVYEVNSGTEQYYEIDVSKLVKDEANNRYLVMIGTNDDGVSTTLALTNLKVSGYELGFAEQETVAAINENNIDKSPVLTQFKAMRTALKEAGERQEADEEQPVPEEPATEEASVNESLEIQSAALKASKVVSGKQATISVKAGEGADTLAVLDADGNPVEFSKITSKTESGVVTFQAMWVVTGNRGDVLPYTVVVYDADGLVAANTMEVSVTIK